jgi:hypothetical protein
LEHQGKYDGHGNIDRQTTIPQQASKKGTDFDHIPKLGSCIYMLATADKCNECWS